MLICLLCRHQQIRRHDKDSRLQIGVWMKKLLAVAPPCTCKLDRVGHAGIRHLPSISWSLAWASLLCSCHGQCHVIHANRQEGYRAVQDLRTQRWGRMHRAFDLGRLDLISMCRAVAITPVRIQMMLGLVALPVARQTTASPTNTVSLEIIMTCMY